MENVLQVIRMHSDIEERIEKLESFMNWAKPLLEEVATTLELSRPRVNPARFCSDELDFKIINYLIEHKAAGTTEIAAALGLPDPKLKSRHLVGKRLQRLANRSSREGWHILEFHPERKEGKFRAWWIDISEIDVEAFRKSLKAKGLT